MLLAIDVGNTQTVFGLFDGESLSELLWSFAPGERPAPRTMADVPAVTCESTAMARELKRRGFRFVGPTVCYAFMQGCGLVNDHTTDCFRYV